METQEQQEQDQHQDRSKEREAFVVSEKGEEDDAGSRAEQMEESYDDDEFQAVPQDQ